MKIVMLAGIFALLLGCSGSNSRYGDYDNNGAEVDAAADAADEAAEETKQAVYEERGADSDGTGANASNVDASGVADIGSHACTQDCSGHESGFAWAQENDVTDAADCGGNSQSFIEGCEAFAEERQEQADNEAQEAAEHASVETRIDPMWIPKTMTTLVV